MIITFQLLIQFYKTNIFTSNVDHLCSLYIGTGSLIIKFEIIIKFISSSVEYR